MFSILNRIALQLIAPRAVIRAKYKAFKELLHYDRLCHKRLAELEELHYRNRKADLNHIRRLQQELCAGVSGMVECLERMSPAANLSVGVYAGKIAFDGRSALTPLKKTIGRDFILEMGEYPDDLQTGGKGLHLCRLKQLGLPVSEGFIESTAAFEHLQANNLRPRIDSLLSRVDIQSAGSLHSIAARLTAMVEEASMPERLAREILNRLALLAKSSGTERFAVRSSAVSEDSAIFCRAI
jgi:pyruvate,water dikinase